MEHLWWVLLAMALPIAILLVPILLGMRVIPNDMVGKSSRWRSSSVQS